MSGIRRPREFQEEVAQKAVDQLVNDRPLQGRLGARGYVPLLDWAAARAVAGAALLGGEADAEVGAKMVATLLRRLVGAALWKPRRTDATSVFRLLALGGCWRGLQSGSGRIRRDVVLSHDFPPGDHLVHGAPT